MSACKQFIDLHKYTIQHHDVLECIQPYGASSAVVCLFANEVAVTSATVLCNSLHNSSSLRRHLQASACCICLTAQLCEHVQMVKPWDRCCETLPLHTMESQFLQEKRPDSKCSTPSAEQLVYNPQPCLQVKISRLSSHACHHLMTHLMTHLTISSLHLVPHLPFCMCNNTHFKAFMTVHTDT